MTHAPAPQITGEPVRPGEVFAGKYVIEREIGAGGMGVVFAARHQQLGQTVAIKLLAVPPEMRPEAVRRFLAEAQAAARLHSEHVARVMDADIDDKGRHYIIMEYLQGADLGRTLRDTGPLPVSDAVGYLLQACEGIAEAHANGIVHRDLKPENLFVTRRIDGSPLIKVLDFGISKMVANDLRPQLAVTPRGALMGSPLYMSPEQLRMPSTIDARSDVWGLGVILYELLTDKIPFGGAELPEVIAAVLTAPPTPVETLRPDLPSALALVVARALEKDPARRIPNVAELARSLQPWAPAWASDAATRAMRTLGFASNDALTPGIAETGTPRPVGAPAPGKAPASRRRAAAIGAGFVVVLAAAGLAFLSGGAKPAAPPSAAPSAPAVVRIEVERLPARPQIEVSAVAPPPAPAPAVQRRPEPPVAARSAKSKPKPKRLRASRVDPLEGRK